MAFRFPTKRLLFYLSGAYTWQGDTGEAYRIQEEALRLYAAAPAVPIQSDPQIRNALRHFDGAPVLADWNGAAVGPREWDIATVAVHCRWFDPPGADAFAEFTAVYGWDAHPGQGSKNCASFVSCRWSLPTRASPTVANHAGSVSNRCRQRLWTAETRRRMAQDHPDRHCAPTGQRQSHQGVPDGHALRR